MRSLSSPLTSLKRSYATRGRMASCPAGPTASKRPRLHQSMSRACDDSAEDNDSMWQPPQSQGNNNSNGEPHVVSRDNSSDEENSSDDDNINTESSAHHRSHCGPVLFRNRPRMYMYKAPSTAEDPYMDDDTDDDASSCCEASVVSVQSPCVHFAPTLVSRVVEIPSHRSYPPQEKVQIWNSLKALRKEAKRNRIEWQWEGCKAENVAEEHQFLPDAVGNFLHPAHQKAQS